MAPSRHRPGRRTDAGRVSDAGVRPGGTLPGGCGKRLERRPASRVPGLFGPCPRRLEAGRDDDADPGAASCRWVFRVKRYRP
ncbi:hypothetical protein EBB05_04910 [Methylobacterium brachiatum]|nr:hypothetical protein EBB05_04910 [Methylobacterium brachiatum]